MTSKAQTIQEKIDKLDFIEIKNAYTSKVNLYQGKQTTHRMVKIS